MSNKKSRRADLLGIAAMLVALGLLWIADGSVPMDILDNVQRIVQPTEAETHATGSVVAQEGAALPIGMIAALIALAAILVLLWSRGRSSGEGGGTAIPYPALYVQAMIKDLDDD